MAKKRVKKQKGKGRSPLPWPQLAGNARARRKKNSALKKVPRGLKSKSKHTKAPGDREAFKKVYIKRRVYQQPPVGVVNTEKTVQEKPSQMKPQQIAWEN